MDKVKLHINYVSKLNEFVQAYPSFGFLTQSKNIHHEKYAWIWGERRCHFNNIMFIGKTGYGKSTTLNKIVGKEVFETSDVCSCTKDLYCAMYTINEEKNEYLTFTDLPGIGESNYADDHYYKWYREMLYHSQVVVYLLRADQRDFAVDEILFNNMFNNEAERKKVILAINCADKVEPISRKRMLSEEQVANLLKKKEEAVKAFGIPQENILFYSASEGINMDLLLKKISEKLKEKIGEDDE